MNSALILQDVVYVVALLAIGYPLGCYIYKIYNGERVALMRIFAPLEQLLYRVMGVDEEQQMHAKKYASSVLWFSVFGFLIVLGLHLVQAWLPLNPEQLENTSVHLAYNTAASFVSNTNWQAYSGETTLSYLTQMAGLTVQNFVSAATGIAVLFVLCRGFVRRETKNLGNFWSDLVKITLYILLPLSVVVCLILVSQGVVQTLDPYASYTTLEGTQGVLPLGPAASQIAIKQLGTNGGGFFGVNSAFPYENATPLSNIIEALCLLLIPAALCFTFGKAVKDTRQGKTILIVMTVIFVAALVGLSCAEIFGAPSWDSVASLGGSMEGKETRFGVGGSSLWAAATTAASNGSVNAMHDSLTPLGGMITMFLMQLGEVVFGGVGCGLYGMLAFALLTVFMAGLMVGRTPEYIGKKINAFDMKMVCIIILVPPLCLLLATAITTLFPAAQQLQADGGWLSNTGSHGFSEILYAYTSMAGNNGSAFAGFQANTVLTNVMGGTVMLLVRFLPMVAVIYLAQSLASKKYVPAGSGTLATTSPLFVGFLIVIVLIVGALTFLPVLALGPLAEFFTQLHVLG